MRAKISKSTVDKHIQKPGDQIADSELRGLRVIMLKSGTITYQYRYRRQDGKRMILSLGIHGSITPEEARRLAKKRAGEVADDRDPVGEREESRKESINTVDHVLDQFTERYLRKQALRSAEAIEKTFARLVRPRIGQTSIYAVTRRDIREMLDGIEDGRGPVMADRTLAYLRKAFRWWQVGDDQFTSPIVTGMARTKPIERQRQRILSDEEIRDVWRALDELGAEAPVCFPSFVRLLLLTGQRRENVSHARAEELQGNDWIIPKARNKIKLDHLVPLSAAAARQMATRDVGYLISSDNGETGFSGYSKGKAVLDRKIAELRKSDGRGDMPHWVLHDLRRTARTILSNYASPDVAERVLGHVLPAIRRTYDLNNYAEQKRAALEALAAHVERALNPAPKVVRFPKRRRQ